SVVRSCFFFILRPPLRSTLFPYTTLFRSWLFGSDRETIQQRIHNPMHGVMPAWGGRLDPVTIKMLAAYVHSLGGGEDFVEVAQRSEEHTSELQSRENLVCRLLLEKKNRDI